MNDIPENGPPKKRPLLSLDQAHARLTAPGAPFEVMEATIRGIPMTVWKHVPATAREAFEKAQAHGTREFLVYEDQRVRYDDFTRAVTALAAHLHQQGIRKGDRIALTMRNLPEWPVVFMAGLLTGAIMVPLNAWWTATELAYGLLDCGARFVFADGERLERLKDLPPSVEMIFVTRCNAADCMRLEDVIGTPAQWRDLPDGELPDVALSPEDDATIFYTSGTSGAPKGALGTHRALTTNIFAMPFSNARNALRWGDSFDAPSGLRSAGAATATSPTNAARAGEAGPAQRITLIAVPFFHVIGSLSILLPNMVAGGKLVLMRKFESEAAQALIEREGVMVTGGVPAIALSLLEHQTSHDLSSLQLITYGGAPSP
ncbi:MAG TPA: AMP-binding protein, partial [Rhizomicrobium sp.]|nr:AMP-binding protein [Rhizomicrobium sp.]